MSTLTTLKARMFQKLNVSNVAELVHFAFKSNILH